MGVWLRQHIDTPDNNPDLPWEFTDANKQKVIFIFICGPSGIVKIRTWNVASLDIWLYVKCKNGAEGTAEDC